MNPYQITFTLAVASMCFWFGVALMGIVMLSTNLVRPFRFQMVAPSGRWHYKKFSGIERGHVWRTIEPYVKQGWSRYLLCCVEEIRVMATTFDSASGLHVCIRQRGYVVAYGATEAEAEARADAIETAQAKRAQARKAQSAPRRRGRYNFTTDRIETVTE